MTYTTKRLEEIMIEFDIKQRLFLAGKYHSTAFNIWFQETLATSIAQATDSLKEELI